MAARAARSEHDLVTMELNVQYEPARASKAPQKSAQRAARTARARTREARYWLSSALSSLFCCESDATSLILLVRDVSSSLYLSRPFSRACVARATWRGSQGGRGVQSTGWRTPAQRAPSAGGQTRADRHGGERAGTYPPHAERLVGNDRRHPRPEFDLLARRARLLARALKRGRALLALGRVRAPLVLLDEGLDRFDRLRGERDPKGGAETSGIEQRRERRGTGGEGGAQAAGRSDEQGGARQAKPGKARQGRAWQGRRASRQSRPASSRQRAVRRGRQSKASAGWQGDAGARAHVVGMDELLVVRVGEEVAEELLDVGAVLDAERLQDRVDLEQRLLVLRQRLEQLGHLRVRSRAARAEGGSRGGEHGDEREKARAGRQGRVVRRRELQAGNRLGGRQEGGMTAGGRGSR